jgi:hypothetical protein
MLLNKANKYLTKARRDIFLLNFLRKKMGKSTDKRKKLDLMLDLRLKNRFSMKLTNGKKTKL